MAPERRRPAATSRRAHVQLTARDLAVLADLTRFWCLAAEQVAHRHFGARNTAANRLAQLASTGYVRVERPRYRGPAIYLATGLGARLADMGLPAARFSPAATPHRLAVADLADALLARRPGAAWIAERELRRDGMQTVRDRRRGQLLSGTPHAPDGVLLLPGGPPGGIAVELERSAKKQAEYERILRWYGAADYRRVVWFCATEALRRRLEELISDERMGDFMAVQLVPAGVSVAQWG